MRIKSFHAWRPPEQLTAQLASLPYDVVSVSEARELTRDNPHCFMHVTVPLADLPEDTPEKDDIVYRKARENFDHFLAKGYLVKDSKASLFLYRLNMNGHVQRGVVNVVHVKEYEEGRIKKHEHTRAAPEEDRTRHIQALDAQAGPVFLTYRDQPEIDALLAKVERSEKPLFDYTAVDGIVHTGWRIPDSDRLVGLFARLPEVYIADGHHRAAASVRAAREIRERHPEHTGDEEYNWFLNVLFPAGQLRIMPYNRCVADLNGLSPEAFMARLKEQGFAVSPTQKDTPGQAGIVCMYLGGAWHELRLPKQPGADVVAAMDVSVLQDRLLAPVLGIDDPRKNPRIHFVGGIRGARELKKRVDNGQDAVAFSMYPTSLNQLMAVSDAGRVMPPKSTWFEPKLRSGLFVHLMESE